MDYVQSFNVYKYMSFYFSFFLCLLLLLLFQNET